ncbi:MAG: glycosyltransferase family 4 protein [Actinobacteria bacterium]|nr:glycosyltransferase family 4 protein [Actinomycetota bacterium]
MKIAVIGAKGIPAQFGGIERHCDELYPRLAARGHEVTVFVREWYTPVRGVYKGVYLKRAPTLNRKGLDAFMHSAAASLISLRGDYDIVHYHAIGPSLFSFIPKFRGMKTVATVHALDWQRAKWGALAREILKAGEWASAHFPRKTIVVSHDLQRYFRERYGRETVYIPNGVVSVEPPESAELIRDFGIAPGRYILFLGRLVPEKGCHDLIAAYLESGVEMPLVIAGGSSHSDKYAAGLEQMSAGKDNVIFTGNVEGDLLTQLSAHAGLFVLPSMLEGLPIVVLEMLMLGVPVLASDIGPSREVLEDGRFGALYRAGDQADLQEKLLESLENLEELRRKAEAGRKHVQFANDWEKIAEDTERVYTEALAG